jgi:peptidoglycan/LPS O-acetylase OafA/YrhL
MEPPMRAPTGRIAYLDGWRVVALALVFLDHLGMNRQIGAFYAGTPFGFVADYGETGVFIFFFISGYVVSRTCLDEVEATGAFSATAFYARLLLRIVPPLMLYLVFCLTLGLGGVIDFSYVNFFSSALYLCNSTAPGVSCNWYVGHTWSLAFEEQFYCLFPVVFACLELGRRPKPAIAAVVTLFASVPLVFTIWWIGKTGFLIAYALFIAGYAAAKHAGRFIGFFRGHEGAALLLSALIVFLPRGVVASPGADDETRAQLIALYRLLYIGAIPTLVLLSGAATGFLHKFLANRPMAFLGRASYSIYLWQQLCNGPVFNGLDAASQFGLLLVMTGFCLLLFQKLELRLIGYGRALSNGIARKGTAAANPPRPAPRAVLEKGLAG